MAAESRTWGSQTFAGIAPANRRLADCHGLCGPEVAANPRHCRRFFDTGRKSRTARLGGCHREIRTPRWRSNPMSLKGRTNLPRYVEKAPTETFAAENGRFCRENWRKWSLARCYGSSTQSKESEKIFNIKDLVAGAGGFEPPNGGTKNRCLTTWRRPNARCVLECAGVVRNWRSAATGSRRRPIHSPHFPEEDCVSFLLGCCAFRSGWL